MWGAKMIKFFFLSFFLTLSVIFTVHNIAEYNRSFDNCERLIAEVNQNLAILENELQTLNQSMGVDYE